MAYNIANNKVMTEAEKTAALSKCTCGKSADFKPIVWDVETVPTARVRDRFQHNRNFNTMTSGIDIAKKIFWFQITKGGTPDNEMVTFSFDEVAKEFGWKSFTFECNDETIRPNWRVK